MGQRSTSRFRPKPDRSKRALILVAVLLVLFLIGLDYIGWLKGVRSFIFPLVLGKHVAPNMTQFYQLITRQLSAYGVKRRAVSGFTDREGVFHLKVDLPLARYQLLAGPLERALIESGAKILAQEASRDKDRAYYLWTIEGRRKERLALLFSCSLPAKGKTTEPTPPPVPPGPRPVATKFVALIIDDMGHSLNAAREVCGLGLPLTVSILPYSLHGTEAAQLAHECGLEVMLHLPMESLGNHRTEKSTPGMITADMKDEDIRRTAEDDLGQIPYIRGVNNHMGSKLTQEKRPLSLVLEPLKEKGLYFIDSRTSTQSLACDLARAMGIPSGASSLFIDPGDDASALSSAEIKANFLELVEMAKRNGQAIGIGHPRPATISALKDCLPLLKNSDVSFVFASRLAQK
jgi:polysaccharide deacetylase 2 family uncharacterized protein YibQ